jgi:hypothetical protein
LSITGGLKAFYFFGTIWDLIFLSIRHGLTEAAIGYENTITFNLAFNHMAIP